MTILMMCVFLTLLIGYFFFKPIRTYNKIIYAITLMVSALSFLFETNIINMGYLGLSLFLVVMFVSVMDASVLKKRLMGIRAELAVIGSIFTFTHGLKYIVFAIDFSFFWEAPFYFYVGIVSVMLMIPLTVTSLMEIRKKMTGKAWKKLHKLSYLFYALIAMHLLLIQNARFWYYSAIYGTYVLLKVINLYQMKHKTALKTHPSR